MNATVSRRMSARPATVLRLATDLFFLWVIYQFALGGWDSARLVLSLVGAPAWLALAIVVGLVLYRSDLSDIPLFVAAYALGYWGESWGTTHGIWTYWNHATPPNYLPPLWAIGLLTVTHLRLLVSDIGARLRQLRQKRQPLSPARRRALTRAIQLVKAASFAALPIAAFAASAPRLAQVDWTGRLDAQLVIGSAAGIALIGCRFDVDEAFGIYVCGMLLGGTYEWLGTWMHEWTYVTHEVPPLWIIPLWGLACIAMCNLARIIVSALGQTINRAIPRRLQPSS